LSEVSTKRTYYLAAVAIVAIVLISVFASTRPLTIQSGSQTPQVKTLQVTGMGSVSANPDEAVLVLAVQTQAATAVQASSDNAAMMSTVMNALVNVGVSKSAIQTVSYTLTPMYGNTVDQTTPAKLLGYVARNAIQVTLTDLSSVGKVLDTAVNAGVNEVQDVEFTLSPSAFTAVERQASQLAIADADANAKAIASTLGVTLIGPISVSPEYTYQPIVQRLTAGPAASTPIQPGTLQVTASVQITYQIQ
jgi:uncharacterized protein YggE